jgi:integrase
MVPGAGPVKTDPGALEASSKERPCAVLFALLAKAGLRPGDAFAIKPGDLDHRERTVRVERVRWADVLDRATDFLATATGWWDLATPPSRGNAARCEEDDETRPVRRHRGPQGKSAG